MFSGFVTDISNSGSTKRFFDVLVCGPLSMSSWVVLRKIYTLRTYLQSFDLKPCDVRFYVTRSEDQPPLRALGFGSELAEKVAALPNRFGDELDEAPRSLKEAISFAVGCDADMILCENHDWYPFIQDIEGNGHFIGSVEVLLRQLEIFVRGFDVTWSFVQPGTNMTWTTFYPMTEKGIFTDGMQFLWTAHKANLTVEAQNSGRTLVYNRVPNLLFTRDRLLFIEMQKRVAVRRNWLTQHFRFELAYYVNVYYLMLWGGMDQLASLVNRSLGLGVPERKVGAKYETFLQPLFKKAPEIAAEFQTTKILEFMDRVGYFRHSAAHREPLTPRQLVQKPKVEPTNEELDAEIAAADLDFSWVPDEKTRNEFIEMARSNFRSRKYEEATIADSVLMIETDGKYGFIRPLSDVEWNSTRYLNFMNSVFRLLTQYIQIP
jgi:hypothetical protein